MINYTELFEKSKKLANELELTQLELYQRFMFERILERISVSKYRNNFSRENRNNTTQGKI